MADISLAFMDYRQAASGWPVYLSCANLLNSARQRIDAKVLVAMIEFPQQSPDETDEDYRFIKSVLYLRMLKAILDSLACWSASGVRIVLPGDTTPTRVYPRLALFTADIMEQRMLAAIYGSYSVRCLTPVIELKSLIKQLAQGDSAASSLDASDAPVVSDSDAPAGAGDGGELQAASDSDDDIAFKQTDVDAAVKTPKDVVCDT
jgi:hypothetical protein